MPNICTNTVRIVGEKENIKKLLDKVVIEDKESYDSDTLVKVFDLTQARPQPTEFDLIHKGSATINGEQVSHWKLRDKTTGEIVEGSITSSFGNENIEMVKVTEEETQELINKYGSSDWYGWRAEAWGTKWVEPKLLTDTEIWEEEGWSEMEINLECESAWGPPHELLDFISCEYDIHISNRWWEEGGGLGWDHYNNEYNS